MLRQEEDPTRGKARQEGPVRMAAKTKHFWMIFLEIMILVF